MKKTLITLALAAGLSSFVANAQNIGIDSGYNAKHLNDDYVVITNDDGKVVGYVNKEGAIIQKNSDGSTSVIGEAKLKGEHILVNIDGESGDYYELSLGTKDENGNSLIIEKGEITPDRPTDSDPVDPGFDLNPDSGSDSDTGSDLTPGTPNEYIEAAKNQAKTAYNELDGKIDDLRADFEQYAADTTKRLDELDDRMDATNASLHAVTNARPYVANGQTAFGAGVGFAGDTQAVAVGVAHSFTDSQWSVSATVNATTGSHSEFNGGAGAQYVF